MAYDKTEVPIAKSQDSIRKLIYGHRGSKIALISEPPREGFEGVIEIEKVTYHIRIMATCREVSRRTRNGSVRTERAMNEAREQENRRVWRVLYWHLKAIFEAADSGVIDVRDVILPYVVMRDGQTISQHLVPRMGELMGLTEPSRLLT